MGYHFCFTSNNNKIWIFCEEILNCEIVCDEEQVVTCQLDLDGDTKYLVSVVYAKSEHAQRFELLDSLRALPAVYSMPWTVVGILMWSLRLQKRRVGYLIKPTKVSRL